MQKEQIYLNFKQKKVAKNSKVGLLTKANIFIERDNLLCFILSYFVHNFTLVFFINGDHKRKGCTLTWVVFCKDYLVTNYLTPRHLSGSTLFPFIQP